MVATRRGTRVEPREDGETSAAAPTSEEVISSLSQMHTRRSAVVSGQTGENSTNESKSEVTSRSPLKPDPAIPHTQMTTRSRHKSGQSDTSESESTASNSLRRRSDNTQSLDQLPDSTRELRSRRIPLITDTIVESKEDEELSDAQSNCSSVRITPRKNQSGTSTRSGSTRGQSSLLVAEPTFDGADAQSNSNSVSGGRSTATRSTRSSRARRPSSPVREPEKEQTSDAESCSSGISIQPLAKRSSRRNKSNLQSDKVALVIESNKDDYSEQETFNKQSPKKHGVKSDASSLVGEQNVLSSHRRTLRSRSAIKKDVVVISDDEPEVSRTVNKVLDLEEAKVEESSVAKDADLVVETSTVSAVQTQPEEDIIVDQVLQPSEASMDEEPAVEKSNAATDDDATEGTTQSVQDVQESANMSGSPNTYLIIDSSDSEKSEHSEDEEDENNMQVEVVESVQVVDEPKSKKASTKRIQDVSGDGLFVIDKAAGVDVSKKCFLEHADDHKNDAAEKGETLVSDDEDEEEDENIIEIEEDDVDKEPAGKKGESSELDDDEEDENSIEVIEDDDDNEPVDKCKSKKSTKRLQDVSGDGLFVIDKSPGVDSSQKCFLEDDDKNDAGEKGETLVSDEDENIIEIEEDDVDDEAEAEEGESSRSADDEEHKNSMEVEEDNEQVVEKRKSKKASKPQIQDVDKHKMKKASKQQMQDIDKRKSKKAKKLHMQDLDKCKSKKLHIQDMDKRKSKKAKQQQIQDIEKRKSKQAKNQQLRDVSGDGLLVIGKTAGVDASKKDFLEHDDDKNDAAEKGETLVSDEDENIIELEEEDVDEEAEVEEGESSRSVDDEEQETSIEVEEDDDDNEQVMHKHKSKKASKQQLQDVSGDGLFVIDKAPGLDSSKKYFLEPADEEEEEAVEKVETPELDEDDDDFIDEEEQEDEEETLINRPKRGFAMSTSIDTGINLKEMGGLYINFDAAKPNPGPSLLSKMKKESKKKDELLQKSVITPDFEKKESVPPYLESRNQLKKIRKEQRDKTTGRGWFDMKAPELTHELKNDLKALKMRSAMDPKHFYKKNDRQGFPKYFEVGTIVDNPIDYYHSRIPKKERKRTMVDELLADSELRRYNKKKFKEIMAEKAARAEGKKKKKKKKFRS